MRLNIDTPQIQNNDLPPDLNKWFANATDQINTMFGNLVGDRVDVGNNGAAPPTVSVLGMTAESVITADIQSSTNVVQIVTVTAVAGGFDIVFDGDPGLNCVVNYQVSIQPWKAQGA